MASKIKNIWFKWFNLIVVTLIVSFTSINAFSENPLTFLSSALTTDYCQQLLVKGVITHANPVSCARLRRIYFSYLDESSNVKQDGEWVVLDVLAAKVVALTQKLLEQNFVIYNAKPIENYQGDDEISMADNNSSAFNGRTITGASSWSLHAYGAAIDINPVQNPFIDINVDGTARISPLQSAHYAVNRSSQRPGKLPRLGLAEEVVDTFALHGFFIWGGDWDYPIDYQHFQVGPRSFVGTLAAMEPHKAEVLLDQYISLYRRCKQNRHPGLKLEEVRAECADIVISEMR